VDFSISKVRPLARSACVGDSSFFGDSIGRRAARIGQELTESDVSFGWDAGNAGCEFGHHSTSSDPIVTFIIVAASSCSVQHAGISFVLIC
jgi:hypothetical protein